MDQAKALAQPVKREKKTNLNKSLLENAPTFFFSWTTQIFNKESIIAISLLLTPSLYLLGFTNTYHPTDHPFKSSQKRPRIGLKGDLNCTRFPGFARCEHSGRSESAELPMKYSVLMCCKMQLKEQNSTGMGVQCPWNTQLLAVHDCSKTSVPSDLQ